MIKIPKFGEITENLLEMFLKIIFDQDSRIFEARQGNYVIDESMMRSRCWQQRRCVQAGRFWSNVKVIPQKMNRTTSLGRCTQSCGAKEICILLVNDDYICRNIVSDMLDHCRYEAFSYESEMDALNIIREKKDDLELILTNINRTYANRYGIIDHIKREFKLQIVLMPVDIDGEKNASRSGGNGVMVYIMKSLSVNDINNLWATSFAREKGKTNLSSSGKLIHIENGPSSVASEACKRTRTIEINEENGNVEKKPRVVWTKEMHQKFLDAVAQLGHDKAFPKKIVELMNLPGLTRENVASHLQKYRMCMKRAQEGFTGSSYDFLDPFGFNTSQRNLRQPHWNPFGTGSRNAPTTHSGLNYYGSRFGMPPDTSFLNTICLKPDHNFRVYGDEKKSVLLSIGENRVSSNTSFAGFRLAGDGKSVEFGQNSHFGDGTRIVSENESYIQQQHSLPEVGNDDFSHPLSLPFSFTSAEPVKLSSNQQWQSSIAGLIDVDKTMPHISTQPPPNPLASLTQQPSSWSNWAEPIKLPYQQSCIPSLQDVDQTKNPITTPLQPCAATSLAEWDEAVSFVPPQSAALLWTEWAEPASVSSQPPAASGNDTNANSEIFSDFTSSSLPPEFHQLGMVGDDNGVDTTAICMFDDLFFDRQDLT